MAEKLVGEISEEGVEKVFEELVEELLVEPVAQRWQELAAEARYPASVGLGEEADLLSSRDVSSVAVLAGVSVID